MEQEMKIDDLREILGKIMEGSAEDWEYSNNGYTLEEYQGQKADGYSFKLIESRGGEGEGDTMTFVFGLYNPDLVTYFKVEGYYDSWNGTSWEDGTMDLVYPDIEYSTEWKITDCSTEVLTRTEEYKNIPNSPVIE